MLLSTNYPLFLTLASTNRTLTYDCNGLVVSIGALSRALGRSHRAPLTSGEDEEAHEDEEGGDDFSGERALGDDFFE